MTTSALDTLGPDPIAEGVFLPYPKVPRLQRGIIITEKIDGTNAQIVFVPADAPDGDCPFRMLVGSRKRWIHPGKNTDNFGFAAWCEEHRNLLWETLGPGQHYGEWWGQGIQRGYGLDHKRFSLFNPARYGDTSNGTESLIDGVPLFTVPVLGAWGTHDSRFIDETFLHLADSGSWAAPGFDKPEGIMVYHTGSKQLYKRTFEGDAQGKERAHAEAIREVTP